VNVVRSSASILTSTSGPTSKNATIDPGVNVEANDSAKNESTFEQIDTIMATKTFAEWAALLDAEPRVLWAPVNTVADVLADPQTAAAGAVIEVDDVSGPVRQVANPVDFHGSVCTDVARSPELGEHTADIVSDLRRDASVWPTRQLVDH